jgi:G3E family GTPase
MVGGFLGSGKTTVIARLARWLSARGLRVGLIMNDQGANLVDTTLLRSQGFATEEITGGCFCCRFNSLLDAARKLGEGARPDVIIAEPVGSCTDLIATVSYPLRRLYGEDFTVAPVSVMVDPIRALRVFGLAPGANFSDKVVYIYMKQIEEADLVVIGKSDLLDQAALTALRAAISARFPGKQILSVSARNNLNLEGWFESLLRKEQRGTTTLDVDYAAYADGEARLGWLNSATVLKSRRAFDPNVLLRDFAVTLQGRLRAAKAEVAHLKATLKPDSGLGEVGIINLVRNDFAPEAGLRLEEPATGGELILNLRAEAPPEVLEAAFRDTVGAITAAHPGLKTKVDHFECFQPGKPVPTHRLYEEPAAKPGASASVAKA